MEGWQTQLVAAPAVEVASRLQLTVLLPAYNEAEAIGRVLREIVEALSALPGNLPWDYEILVVDDASTDRTADVVDAFAAECWQCAVRLIRCTENRGAGAARKVGIRAARGEIIVMLDA